MGRLHWPGMYGHVVETPKLSAMVKRFSGSPRPGQHVHRLCKASGRLLHRDSELVELTPLVAAPDAQIQAPIAEQVDRRRLLSELDRVVERQHGHGSAQTNGGRYPGQVRQHRQRCRHATMTREMVFGKPDGVKAKLLRPAHLLQGFLVVLHLRSWLRQLHRLEEPEFHRCLLCCNASDTYTSLL